MYYMNPWAALAQKEALLVRLLASLKVQETNEFETWGDYQVPAVMLDYQDR